MTGMQSQLRVISAVYWHQTTTAVVMETVSRVENEALREEGKLHREQ